MLPYGGRDRGSWNWRGIVATLHEPMVGADEAGGRLRRVLPEWWMQETPVVALTSTELLPAETWLLPEMIDARVAPQLKQWAARPRIG